jgi:hypothetical protein
VFRALRAVCAGRWAARGPAFREQAFQPLAARKLTVAQSEAPCKPGADQFAAQSFEGRAFADAPALRVSELAAPEPVFVREQKTGAAESRRAALTVVRLPGSAELAKLELWAWVALREQPHAAQLEVVRSALPVSQPELRAWLPARAV